ncbi:MAG TPA: DinB family protein [Gemmatimonadales bacterium]|jgi:hypothetical protein|nr:DinB family protein [Gemmatimonadales bacterium]
MISQTASIGAMLVRELNSLRLEIEAYPTDADLWAIVPGIVNPGGTLALHLSGNLQHFVGAVLGGSTYVRNRDAEFSTRGLSRVEVVQRVDDAISAVQTTFKSLEPSDLAAEYPEPVAKMRLNTGDFLTHLASHLAYHLGQVDYHRRIVTGSPATVGTVAPGRLASARPVE